MGKAVRKLGGFGMKTLDWGSLGLTGNLHQRIDQSLSQKLGRAGWAGGLGAPTPPTRAQKASKRMWSGLNRAAGVGQYSMDQGQRDLSVYGGDSLIPGRG